MNKTLYGVRGAEERETQFIACFLQYFLTIKLNKLFLFTRTLKNNKRRKYLSHDG